MKFIPTLGLALCLTATAGFGAEKLTSYVNPFIGTKPGAPGYIINNSNGNVFPGAVWPQGMVQFSPDTPDGNAGGYIYTAHAIKGFSLTHFSGRGIQCWMDFPVMPALGPVSGRGRKPSKFSHEKEAAEPGYYRVALDGSNILVELTATARTGFARFSFPPSGNPVLQVDTQGDASSAGGGVLQFVSNDTVVGEITGHGCGGRGITY